MKKRALILLILLVTIVIGITAQKYGRRMFINESGKIVGNYLLPEKVDSITFKVVEFYSVITSATEGGTVTPESEIEIEQDSLITFTATPAQGYQFTNWTLNGEVVSTDNPYTATITANTEFVANFENRTEYCTKSGNSSHGERYLSTFTLTDGISETVVSDIQTGTGQALYHDKTSVVLETEAGATVSFKELPWVGKWMHGYVFVDYNNDETFDATLNADGTTGGELVSYNFYSEGGAETGTNSKGETQDFSIYVTASSMPEWTIPSNLAPGDYSMRFNVAWNSIDPCGYAEMGEDGGAMVDVTIRIASEVAARTISVSINDDTMGSAYVGDEGTTTIEGQTGAVKLVAVPNNGYVFKNWTHNGEVVSTEATFIDRTEGDKEYVANFEPDPYNGHEYVDLGLSVKWATCNIGANSPEDSGDYFAWGETSPKDDYSWSTYKYCYVLYTSMTKYCTTPGLGTIDEKTILDFEDDAARVNWGGKWRMPTKEELDELRDSNNCTWTYITQNGVKGYKVTSKINGNSIFLPITGYRSDGDLVDANIYGDYWSSSLTTDYDHNSYFLDFNSSSVSLTSNCRATGRCVRAVYSESIVCTVSVSATEGGIADVSATEVEEGRYVTLTATPNEGYNFVNWTLNGEVVSTENPYTATVTADTEFVANFEEGYCTISGNSRHESSGSSRLDRYLPSFTLTTGVNDLVVSDIQPSSQQALYHNKTSEVLETLPGTTISFKELLWNGEWMHGYVFIDYNKDGVFNNTLNSNGQTGGELVSYNFYSETDDSIGQNSKGETVNHSTYVTATSMPEWTIPSDLASGDYRMRFNIAWCSIDPCGSEEMAINGGAMVDITIRVVTVTPRTISVSVNDEAMGTAYVGEEGTTSLAGETGNVKVVAVANEGYKFVNWTLNGEVVSTDATIYDFTEGDKEFVANFAELEQGYTVRLNNNWRQSTSVNNPNPSIYDGVYESYSNYNVDNGIATMYIDIKDYDEFTIYVRSYGENNYDYIQVYELDSEDAIKTTTKGLSTSSTSISSYKQVIYSKIGGGQHTIRIDYKKDSRDNSYEDRGYVLIPKGEEPETLLPGEENVSGTENGHFYVDLGLPSGLKWATCNVGATTPEGYGDYFAWGETEPKDDYDWSTYKYCNGSSSTLTKYCTKSSYGTVDNKTTLELTDDAARVNWGGNWRMPTKAEQEELMSSSNCTWTWTTQNGVNGYKVTSVVNGNSIFLPAAGYRYDDGLDDAGSDGDYWSSSLYTNNSNRAYYVYFNSSYVDWDNYGSRYAGRSVRAVCP